MWFVCKIEEIRLKAKEDMRSKEQAFATMTNTFTQGERNHTLYQSVAPPPPRCTQATDQLG